MNMECLSEKQTTVVSPTRNRVYELTKDDSKVLGKVTERRREKAMRPQKFQTRMYKTLTSAWTPIVHKPSNEQIFLERRNLVSNWYELWTDSQRKRFLDMIFRQSRRSQLYFVQKWFNEQVPLRHLDFTTVLPRFLSLYVFSFLDPRSLSRAAMVSWHWKFLTEQDAIWAPKCQRRGWYLPYTPADNEYGAWKRHYIACIHTMDMQVLNAHRNSLYGTLGDGTNVKQERKRRGNRLTLEESREVLFSRPPWLPPDHTPRDLEITAKALLSDYNPNDPVVHESLLIHHNKYGIVKAGLLRQSAPAGLQEYGLQQSGRHKHHHILEIEDDPDLRGQRKMLLSQSLQLESYEERRMKELVDQPWEPSLPVKHPVPPRPNLAGGEGYPLPWKYNNSQPVSKGYPSQPHPRIVFISSRVPAAEVLVDAVLFGVIPIVYEYEGTTMESLMSQLDLCLQGRNAQSIGVFAHSEYPWEIRLVHNSTITSDNLDTGEFVQFFQNMANHVLPPNKGGHIDFFIPLSSCEPGIELLQHLEKLTGMQYSAPTGIIGNYNHVNSEWSSNPEGISPPGHYFCASKMNVWANTADQVREACKVTKSIVTNYFEQKHKDLVSQLVGQIVFDATGLIDVQGLRDISEALVEGLIQIGKEQNSSGEERNLAIQNPLHFLARFLIQKAEAVKPGEDVDHVLQRAVDSKKYGGTLTHAATMKSNMLSGHLALDESYDESLQTSENTDEFDNEVAGINTTKNKERKDQTNQQLLGDKDSEDVQDIPEAIEGERGNEGDVVEGMRFSDQPKRSKSPSTSKSRRSQFSLGIKSTGDWNDTLQSYSSLPSSRGLSRDDKIPGRLTADRLSKHPDRRTQIAKEILASETEYMRTLSILDNVFVTPLRSALATNKAVLSAPNLQIIFGDAMNVLDLSRLMVTDLKKRMSDWGPQQCLGDIFVKFTAKLKTYVNFINNYPTVLLTIERSAENSPLFRAFLKRYERTTATKMLTLPEILMLPCRRIKEYTTLLTWFESHTPKDHADRPDLKLAVKTFAELDDLIQQCKLRSERERELVMLQKKIIACPILLEANRFFIKQQDMAHLRPPPPDEPPQLNGYQHIETLGMFLFNDGLVITRRTTRHLPFERASELNYKFETCCGLTRLSVEDIPDSKLVRNAFKIYTPRRSWVCQTEDYNAKINWITLLENTVLAALEDLD